MNMEYRRIIELFEDFKRKNRDSIDTSRVFERSPGCNLHFAANSFILHRRIYLKSRLIPCQTRGKQSLIFLFRAYLDAMRRIRMRTGAPLVGWCNSRSYRTGVQAPPVGRSVYLRPVHQQGFFCHARKIKRFYMKAE